MVWDETNDRWTVGSSPFQSNGLYIGTSEVINSSGQWVGDPANLQGIQGIQGTFGYTGSRGFTGSQGITGTTGFTGSQGIQGITGTTGFTGSQGITGTTGFTGSQGIQGITGFTGSQGVTGTVGYTGSQGITGATGFTGSQGIQGVFGYTGSVGYTGSQGKISTEAATPPTPLYEGQIWFDTQNLKTYVYYDLYWIEVGGSELGTLYARNGFTVASSVLANNESENLTVAGYKSYVLMNISTSHACWVRIYSDTAARTLDETRSIITDPVAGSGVIAEFVTTGNQTQRVTPFIFGGNLEMIPTDDLYIRVTNLSGSSNSINISILLTRLEI